MHRCLGLAPQSPQPVSGEESRSRIGSFSYVTDKFPTKETAAAQDFNFAPKIP